MNFWANKFQRVSKINELSLNIHKFKRHTNKYLKKALLLT